ncbi:response regulator [Patescibacteria group bacterium]|nr:response regulator [Patescibacteria group bacterium]
MSSKRKKNRKILIIEDDIFLAELLIGDLEQTGIDLDLVPDAEKAMEKIKENQPDLIILDIILPGMSGFEFLANIKANKKLSSIPIIILSNLGQKSEIEKGMKLGAQAFLVKANFELDELVQRIQEAVEEL